MRSLCCCEYPLVFFFNNTLAPYHILRIRPQEMFHVFFRLSSGQGKNFGGKSKKNFKVSQKLMLYIQLLDKMTRQQNDKSYESDSFLSSFLILPQPNYQLKLTLQLIMYSTYTKLDSVVFEM